MSTNLRSNPMRLNINNPEDVAILRQVLAEDPAFHGFRRILYQMRVELAETRVPQNVPEEQ